MAVYTSQWKEVLERIREFSKSENTLAEGIVQSVSEDKSTIEVMPLGSNVEIIVQLRAGQGDKGFAVIPAIGSRVVFASMDEMNSGLLLMADLISEVIIDGHTVINADTDIQGSVTINKGLNQGVVIGPKLIAELTKLQVQVEAILAIPATLTANGAVPVTPFEIALVGAITALGALPKPLFNPTLLNNKLKH